MASRVIKTHNRTDAVFLFVFKIKKSDLADVWLWPFAANAGVKKNWWRLEQQRTYGHVTGSLEMMRVTHSDFAANTNSRLF
ncbi:MAG: hypothetical protein WBF03_10905 [Xanthobacteraceae bacterium]